MTDLRTNRIGLGIAYRLGAVLAFGVMTALVKLCAAQHAPTIQIVFFRNALALLPILLVVRASGGFGRLRLRRPAAVLGCSLIWIASMSCGFTSLGVLPLTEFTAISFSAPLIITALSAPILGERVNGPTWAAVVVGFCGMLIVVRPDPANMASVGVLFAVGAAVFAALTMIGMRQLGKTETGPAIAFYFTVTATLIGAAGLPFAWTTPAPLTLFYLVMIGLCGGIGQLLLTQAFRFAPAAVVAPFDYATALCNGLLAFLIWGETPRSTTAVGGALIIASGLYIAWRALRPAGRSPV